MSPCATDSFQSWIRDSRNINMALPLIFVTSDRLKSLMIWEDKSNLILLGVMKTTITKLKKTSPKSMSWLLIKNKHQFILSTTSTYNCLKLTEYDSISNALATYFSNFFFDTSCFTLTIQNVGVNLIYKKIPKLMC